MPPGVDGPVAQCACGHLHPRSAGRLHRRVWRSGARAAGAAFLTFAQHQAAAAAGGRQQRTVAVATVGKLLNYRHIKNAD